MTKDVHIIVSGTARWRQRKVGEHLVARCQALRIIVWGESEEDLQLQQAKAVVLTVLYLFEKELLKPFLEERGFSVQVTESECRRFSRAKHFFRSPSPRPHVHSALQHAYA